MKERNIRKGYKNTNSRDGAYHPTLSIETSAMVNQICKSMGYDKNSYVDEAVRIVAEEDVKTTPVTVTLTPEELRLFNEFKKERGK